MKYLLIIPLALLTGASEAQPRKHVYRNTIKTVQDRVDFSPDTIPVYFKEIVISASGDASERLTAGYIVWQTYSDGLLTASFFINGDTSASPQQYSPTHPTQNIYTRFYKDSAIDGEFLYLDYKPVTNKIIYSIKR